ncbi:tachykinin-like peptides receptor 86C [Leptotrombidium deliense]|uniref:Tachykinin-like peptides receptor 86C n=1 Tax=Leptotrombidium deliense TaxID=299467 RepID=A0A443RUS2_9ACAR|nr:tachykinin-like peptides receptor 86C [Leptotrombidium deliense]
MTTKTYVAIVLPLKPRMGRKTANKVLAVIWIMAFLISIPNIMYSTIFSYRYPDNEIRTVCILVWPDGIAGISFADYL